MARVSPRAGSSDRQLVISEWAIEWMRFSSIALKPTTIASYQSLLRSRILPTFGELLLDDVDGLMVRRWIAELSAAGLSASRIHQVHRLLSQLFRSGVECSVVDRDPCAGVKLPRYMRHETLFLEPRQVERWRIPFPIDIAP